MCCVLWWVVVVLTHHMYIERDEVYNTNPVNSISNISSCFTNKNFTKVCLWLSVFGAHVIDFPEWRLLHTKKSTCLAQNVLYQYFWFISTRWPAIRHSAICQNSMDRDNCQKAFKQFKGIYLREYNSDTLLHHIQLH